jgi:hypothetical protein
MVNRSVTDTSYFPTEDLNDVPTEPVGADTDTSSKDLAFLGYTVCPFTLPALLIPFSPVLIACFRFFPFSLP